MVTQLDGIHALLTDAAFSQKMNLFEASFRKTHLTKVNCRGQSFLVNEPLQKALEMLVPQDCSARLQVAWGS
eukprot:2498389-Alexandrium_andersonii.AAC.1